MRRIFVAICSFAVLSASQTGHANLLFYEAPIDSTESGTGSPGTGLAKIKVDTTASTYTIDATFSGLTGTVTASHVHGPTAVAGTGNAGVMSPVPTYPGFPSGVTAGSYNMTFNMTDLASYNNSFMSGSSATDKMNAFLGALADGKAYLNIHTSTFGSGEIRGFFQAVPEPAAAAMAIAGLGGLALVRRRSRDA